MKQTSTTTMQAASDDAPALTQADFDRAKFRVGMKDVSREQWQTAVGQQLGKTRITIMIDDAVLQAYKARAAGRGYQTLINEALRRDLQADAVKEALREVIREELRAT